MQKQRPKSTSNQTLHSIGRIGLLGALATALAGCVTYVEEPPHATYVAPPPGHPIPPPTYAPPPAVQYQAPPPVAPPPQVVVSLAVPSANPEVAIRAESDFYEPLAAQGDWVVTAAYGRCWRPARVDAGWRPYCNGHWQWTEAGWYWVSDEPWAWATYHYGRWDLTAQFGWVWVPQTEWAPAWVSWREGAGYVGWAPLPPPARVAVGFHEAPPAPRFVFVEERRLVEPVRPTTVIVNNTTVINQTVNITKVNVVNNNRTVIHEGPPREAIERASGRRIQPVGFHELRRQEEAPVVERQRNSPVHSQRNIPPPARTEPLEPARSTPPPTPIPGRPEVNQPAPSAKPAPPEAASPVRVEKKPESVPVVVQPAAKPAATPKVVPPAALNKPAPKPGGKQTEQQLKPGKEKADKESNGKNARQKEEKHKGAEPEPNTPPAATPPPH